MGEINCTATGLSVFFDRETLSSYVWLDLFSLMREPELQDWVTKSKPEDKKAYQLTPEIEMTIDRFFFNHYCQHFRSGAFARANSSMYVLLPCGFGISLTLRASFQSHVKYVWCVVLNDVICRIP